ncbi:MAG: hypothetical protein EXQ95_09320 [Alphaproteobacteria bacterium]|nr:hypothetical protein [Alphaproteobacteria bacterium]
MLTREDCLALCDVEEDVVDAIAEHEHIPTIVATELGHYLVHSPDGELRIRRIILDDIDAAIAACDLKRATRLKLALRHFAENHPIPGWTDRPGRPLGVHP